MLCYTGGVILPPCARPQAVGGSRTATTRARALRWLLRASYSAHALLGLGYREIEIDIKSVVSKTTKMNFVQQGHIVRENQLIIAV